jgi:ribonuclease P protein component
MFPLLSNGAKTFKNNLFLLRFVSKSDQKESRFCFSVSKKVAKSAVVRNRLGRAGYRFLEKYIPKIKPNILAVFSFRAVPKDNQEIIKQLESILNDSLL